MVVVKKRRKQTKEKMKSIPFFLLFKSNWFMRNSALKAGTAGECSHPEPGRTRQSHYPFIPRQLGEEGGPQHDSPQCPNPLLTSHLIHHEPSGAWKAQATSSPPRCNQHISNLGEQARGFPQSWIPFVLLSRQFGS